MNPVNADQTDRERERETERVRDTWTTAILDLIQ